MSDTTSQLFVDMPLARKAWECAGGAIASGVVCGLLLHTTVWAYAIAALVTFIGGAPAGSQHLTCPGAFARTFGCGSLWAATTFLTAQASGDTTVIALPPSMPEFLPWGFIPAVLVGVPAWLIGRSRRRTTRYA